MRCIAQALFIFDCCYVISTVIARREEQMTKQAADGMSFVAMFFAMAAILFINKYYSPSLYFRSR
ncbi:hypothetical protein KKF86_02540 [bacterium]|nr:hypothetical protein [bacterium]